MEKLSMSKLNFLMSSSYTLIEINEISNSLGIEKFEYYGDKMTQLQIVDNLIERIQQLEKTNDLLEILNQEKYQRDRITALFFPLKKEKKKIKVLHLSDLHIETIEDSVSHLLPLKADLNLNLKIKNIDFLIISGDIVNFAKESEYEAASNFISKIAAYYSIDSDKIILCPGNHDLSWDVTKDNLDTSGEILNLDLYKNKFLNYMNFYKKTTGHNYSLDFDKQFALKIFSDKKIIFLELNSAWEINHYHKERASINTIALNNSLSECLDNDFDDFLKICIFHHPVNHVNGMESAFMELLTNFGFKVCFHGHIHNSKNSDFQYDINNKIKLIGAGTFGATKKEMVPGIPLQYNYVEIFEEKIVVNTRKKENRDGAWCADARWNNKEKPETSYEVLLNS